jgi:hypothetical protein
LSDGSNDIEEHTIEPQSARIYDFKTGKRLLCAPGGGFAGISAHSNVEWNRKNPERRNKLINRIVEQVSSDETLTSIAISIKRDGDMVIMYDAQPSYVVRILDNVSEYLSDEDAQWGTEE